ncbi:alpha-actinin-2 isoform X2 [Ictalurus punctatus]|uniref:Alpha-actinin-2 isoform X2 n=1 Tax=Ictalurus punctatus TaxID=7998 RepID=A0A9F7RRQ8_ICTPU|nr:alpha-actinin-2 isoform X2 [Ictalurus punctatus]
MMMTTMVTMKQTETQYNNGYVQEEYMLPEDEWDRDLLLYPAWEKQQRKGEASASSKSSTEDHWLPSPLPDGYLHLPLPQQRKNHH